MGKLSINLLPVEFTAEEVKRAKFYKIQTLGVGIILFMIFLASITVSLRILQSHNINLVQAKMIIKELRLIQMIEGIVTSEL